MMNAANIIQHRSEGSDAFDTLYIGCEKSLTEIASLFRQRELCSVVNGEALACGLVAFVGRAGTRSKNKTHRKNSFTGTLSQLTSVVYHDFNFSMSR